MPTFLYIEKIVFFSNFYQICIENVQKCIIFMNCIINKQHNLDLSEAKYQPQKIKQNNAEITCSQELRQIAIIGPTSKN